jgi:hypothetical protein
MDGVWFTKKPTIGVSSTKIIIEEVLFCMMKHTLEEFVLPYVNAIFSITTTFDLWINKGTLDNFAVMNFF